MIASIRRHVQKRGFQVILWLVLLALVGELIVRMAKTPGARADAIGYVNGFAISKDTYARKVGQENQLLQKIRDQLGADADMFLQQQGYSQKPEERVLNELVQEKLIHTAINKIGAKIGPDYIEKKLSDPMFVMDSLQDYIPQEAYLNPGGLNIQAVLHYLQRQGISDEQFEEKVRSSIEKLLLQEFLASAVYIPKMLINEQYVRFYAKKKFAVAAFALDTYIKKAKAEMPVISDDELKNFFHSNSKMYVVPEKRNGKLWTFSPQTYGITISDKEVEEYYLKHKKQYIDKPEELVIKRILLKGNKHKDIDLIAQELKKEPAKFAELAQQKSEAQEKGKEYAIKRGEKEPRFEEAAFALEKDNDISPVIQTKDGLVIIQRIKRKEPIYKQLAQAKETIKKELLEEKFNRLFALDAQRVIAQSSDLPDAFNKFVTSKKAEEKPTGTVTKNDRTLVARKLFALPLHGKAFYAQENKGYIVELTTIVKSYLPELVTIKEKVKEDFYKNKAAELLMKDLNKAREQLLEGLTTIDAIGKEFKVPVTVTDWVDFKSEETPQFFESKKIAIDRIKLLTQPLSLVQEFTETHGYLIQLKEVETVKEQDFNAKKDELMRSLFQSEIGMLNLTFLNALRNDAKITINQEAVKQAAQATTRRRYA